MNLLNRGNDLQEFFWPIFHFAKQQILESGSLPLWNNLFFSGTPLLPDPQSPLFYPPNIIFLFLPIGSAFIVSFLFHILLGGLGAYLTAKNGFGYSKAAALLTAALYVTAPKIAGHLEAGHFGLVNSFAWLPFVVLAAIKLARSPAFKWSVLLAVSLAGLFFTHVLIFSITVLGVTAFWLAAVISKLVTRKLVIAQFIARPRRSRSFSSENGKSAITFFALGALFTFGLIAISFLPQLEWQSQTTRFLLLEAPDVYPKWTSAGEFLTAVFWPWGVTDIDTEKWLALGLIPSLLALVGFLHLERRTKLLLATLVATLSGLALNNASPFYNLLLSQNWYVLIRVATRPWFIVVLAATFLAGYGFQMLLKRKSLRRVAFTLTILAVAELAALSWSRLSIPVIQEVTPLHKQSLSTIKGVTREIATGEVYEFLQQDEDRFRVFCTTRCLFQKDAAEAGLELVEGYGTLQQTNYYKHAWQLTGAYWNHYTLSIPPTGTYKFEKPQPNAVSLGEYNTKYVVSPYELTDENFVLQEKIGEYLIYKNSAFLHRAYFPDASEAPILSYSPNHIKVDTSSGKHPNLILAEIYSPGWKAYLDGGDEVEVQETPNVLRLVNIKQNTQFVDFKYSPKSYEVGRIISSITVALLITILLRRKFYTSNRRQAMLM